MVLYEMDTNTENNICLKFLRNTKCNQLFLSYGSLKGEAIAVGVDP